MGWKKPMAAERWHVCACPVLGVARATPTPQLLHGRIHGVSRAGGRARALQPGRRSHAWLWCPLRLRRCLIHTAFFKPERLALAAGVQCAVKPTASPTPMPHTPTTSLVERATGLPLKGLAANASMETPVPALVSPQCPARREDTTSEPVGPRATCRSKQQQRPPASRAETRSGAIHNRGVLDQRQVVHAHLFGVVQPGADLQILHCVLQAHRHADAAGGVGHHPLLGQDHFAF